MLNLVQHLVSRHCEGFTPVAISVFPPRQTQLHLDPRIREDDKLITSY